VLAVMSGSCLTNSRLRQMDNWELEVVQHCWYPGLCAQMRFCTDRFRITWFEKWKAVFVCECQYLWNRW